MNSISAVTGESAVTASANADRVNLKIEDFKASTKNLNTGSVSISLFYNIFSFLSLMAANFAWVFLFLTITKVTPCSIQLVWLFFWFCLLHLFHMLIIFFNELFQQSEYQDFLKYLEFELKNSVMPVNSYNAIQEFKEMGVNKKLKELCRASVV